VQSVPISCEMNEGAMGCAAVVGAGRVRGGIAAAAVSLQPPAWLAGSCRARGAMSLAAEQHRSVTTAVPLQRSFSMSTQPQVSIRHTY